MSGGAFVARPSRDELEGAWSVLFRHDVSAICDMSSSVIADIVRGSPSYAPDRYSDAEVKLAEMVLVLRAALIRTQARPLDCPGDPVTTPVRGTLGAAGVRDPDSPCHMFSPRDDCMGDGHYLCRECVHWAKAVQP